MEWRCTLNKRLFCVIPNGWSLRKICSVFAQIPNMYFIIQGEIHEYFWGTTYFSGVEGRGVTCYWLFQYWITVYMLIMKILSDLKKNYFNGLVSNYRSD